MIGLVVVDEAPSRAPEVGGLPVPMRALLALQAAGCEPLGFVGAAAGEWAEAARRDDRVRCPVEEHGEAPAAAHASVSGRLVIDARFAKALVARAGEVRAGGEVVAAHRRPDVAAESVELPGLALRVGDLASLEAAEDALFEGLRKPQDGIVSRAINRAISLRVTRLVAPTGMRPNQLSVGILSFGVAAAALAAQGTWGAMALGGLCFNLQSILDGCDGELARLTYRGSRAGQWIDTVGDDLTNYGFFAGAAWGLHRAGLGALPLALGGVGLGAGLVASGIEYRYLLRIGSGDLLAYPLGFGKEGDDLGAGDTGLARLAGLARPLFKRDFFVFATMVATALGLRATLVMLGLFAVGACVTLSAVLRSEWARRGEAPVPPRR